MGAWHNALREEATREELLQMAFTQHDEIEVLKKMLNMDPRRLAAFAAIESEREYQEAKWGTSASDGRPGTGERSLDEYACYISGYAGSLVGICAAVDTKTPKLETIRKIAALCTAALEQHGSPKR